MSKVFATNSIKSGSKVELTKEMVETYNIRPNGKDENISEEGKAAFRNKLLALLQLGDFESTTNISVDTTNQTICRLHSTMATITLSNDAMIQFDVYTSKNGPQFGEVDYWVNYILADISKHIKKSQESAEEHLQNAAVLYAKQCKQIANAKLAVKNAKKEDVVEKTN